MTIEELKLVYSLLANYRTYECCSDMMLEKETDEALTLVRRDIKLKEMDPRFEDRKIDNQGNPMDDGD